MGPGELVNLYGKLIDRGIAEGNWIYERQSHFISISLAAATGTGVLLYAILETNQLHVRMILCAVGALVAYIASHFASTQRKVTEAGSHWEDHFQRHIIAVEDLLRELEPRLPRAYGEIGDLDAELQRQKRDGQHHLLADYRNWHENLAAIWIAVALAWAVSAGVIFLTAA